MKFGLYFLPSFDPEMHRDGKTLYQQIIDPAVLAEQLGFQSVWASEHHFDIYGGYIPNPIVLLSAISQKTKTMK